RPRERQTRRRRSPRCAHGRRSRAGWQTGRARRRRERQDQGDHELPDRRVDAARERAMIDWFTWTQVAIGLVLGLFAIGLALAKKQPNDVTVLGLALTEVLLLVQVVLAIVTPLNGNMMLGNGLEYW